jgi:hypothetical protein
MVPRRGRKRQKTAPEAELAEDPAAVDLAVDLAATAAGELIAAVAAADDPAVAAAAEARERRLQVIKKRAGYCGLCCDVLRDFQGHCSRRSNCKSHKDSRKMTEDELIRMRAEFDEEDTNPKAAKEKQVAAAKARQAANWKPPETAAVDAEYRMTFGRYSGSKALTVMEVQQRDPGYFKALMSWKNDIVESRPDLKLALDKAGLLADLQEKRPVLQLERARKMLHKIEEERDKEVHPEIKKLRALQQIEASDILVGQSQQEALAIVVGPSKPTKRKYSPSARVLLPHCSVCGQTSHKRQSCPHKDLQGEGLQVPEKHAVVLAHMQNKRQAAIVSRLKYTQIQVRTGAYEKRADKMARAPLKRHFLALSRASPEALALTLLEDGLLHDLKGVPCPRQVCEDSLKEGFLSSNKVLGKMCFNKGHSQNICLKTVYHRCDTCGIRQGVHLHNPIFEGFCGKGSLGISCAVLAMWNCVEGVPVSITVRQLNINEGLCMDYYKRANVIMAAEAHRLQKQLVWGTGSSKTVEVELDATVICKWKTEEEGQLVYRYYCYIGARQRGSTQHFALMPLGVSKSVGEGRVNPETTEAYHAFCKEVFGNKKHNLISMTDGAASYRCRCEVCQDMFEEHHWVNHSRKPHAEFSRPIPAMMADVVTQETRDGMAGTMTLDKEWGLLKAPLPSNVAARTAAQVERCDLLVRAQQFRRMTSNGDRWAAFLEAARHWMAQQRNPGRELCKASLSKLALSQGRLLRRRRAEAVKEELGDLSEVPLSDGEAAAVESAMANGGIDDAELPQVVQLVSKAAQAGREEDADVVLREVSLGAWGGRYWETQAEARCGRHALNNMLGGPQYSDEDLARACSTVLEEIPSETRGDHVKRGGWYSHSILAEALQATLPPVWRLALNRACPEDWQVVASNENVCGVLINLDNTHWVAIAKHMGFCFYCDSMYRPVIVDGADWLKIIGRHPDAFVVVRHNFDG